MNSKIYDKYYLFLDSEIILIESFSKKLYVFTENICSNKINIEFIIFKDGQEEINNIKLFIENDESFFNFLNSEITVGNDKISPFVFNLFISDEDEQWTLFLSFSEEYALFGCNKNLNDCFLKIFNPYQDLKPQEKIEIICDRFVDDFDKNKFISYINTII